MAHAGTAHRYSEKLIAFEHAGAHSEKEKEGEKDTLLWIGGLGDGLLTVGYEIPLFFSWFSGVFMALALICFPSQRPSIPTLPKVIRPS